MTLSRLVSAATALALVVIILGAWVRLSDAGLGCPDWPGCYGHLTVPQAEHEVAAANEAHPERPVEQGKAWKEMIHRYFAGVLGLLSVLIAVVAVRQLGWADKSSKIAIAGVGLICVQAIMGMLTVIWLVKPIIVTTHLAFGLSTACLFWWLALRQLPALKIPSNALQSAGKWRELALFALIILIAQILLGGWTSTNYAALACGSEFPTCQNAWLPETNFSEAFTLWRGLGVDYEGGVLDSASLVTIQWTHRLGAVVATITLLALIVTLYRSTALRVLRLVTALLFMLLLLQVALGIANIILHLPLAVAVAHNGVAALLLLTLLSLNFMLWQHPTTDH